jgi:hypothetical protein
MRHYADGPANFFEMVSLATLSALFLATLLSLI